MSAPALPELWLMQGWLHVGWALVLAGVSAVLMARLGLALPVRRTLAAAFGLWALWPGNLSAAYWLGLAFQAPSVLGALACATWGWAALARPVGARQTQGRPVRRAEAALVLAGMALGWVLLLDTFALLPWAVYALGFGQAALVVVLGLALLPLLQAGAMTRAAAWWAPLAVALFVVLRLPTGNVFDAVMDPWLWLALHGLAVRSMLRNRRTKG
nr:hypothetical protein [uncultured Rhodoferax sp.]